MHEAYQQFKINISSNHKIIDVYKLINYQDQLLKNLLDLEKSEILGHLLRNVIVYSVSALDKFIHELVIKGIIEIFVNLRPTTRAYENINIPLTHINICSKSYYIREFYYFLYKFFSNKTFQTPEKIAEGLSYIWNEKHKWKVIAQELNKDEKYVREKLNNIVIRRNQIVHEADLNMLTQKLQPISIEEVEDILKFIESLGTVIFNKVTL